MIHKTFITIRNKRSGFTLLETMMYIALFSLLMVGALGAVYNIIEGSNHNLASAGIEEEGTFINRKIAWALTGATAVATTSPTTLVITRPDLGAQSPLQISESAGEMLISRGGAAPIPLNNARFTVSNTLFTIATGTGGVPPSVKAIYNVNTVPFIFKSYLHN